jgi:molybdopterin-biosynthesis enzyme MoeA-like protein
VLHAEGPDGFRLSNQVEFQSGDESAISRMLSDLARRHPGVHARARLLNAGESSVRMRITVSAEGPDREALQALIDAATADLRARLGLEVTRKSDQSFIE